MAATVIFRHAASGSCLRIRYKAAVIKPQEKALFFGFFYGIMSGMDYKEVVIGRKLSAADVEAVEFFNQRINPQHAYLSRAGQRMTLHLRRIDLIEAESLLSERQSPAASTAISDVIAAIKGIKSYGLQSRFRVYVDYNRERKTLGRKAKEAQRGKHYYANDHDFSTAVNTPPPELVDQIVCADAKATLARLPDNCVDLIFTSPPYNFGLDYENHAGDSAFWRQYFDALFGIFDEGIRTLKFGGRFIVNIQPLYSDYIPSHHIISHYFMERKMIWKGEVIWDKNNYNCKYSAWGSWQSPSNPYLKGTWEFLQIFCKGSLKKAGRREDIDLSADEFKQWVISRWSIAPERRMKEYGHPAMFPEKLAQRAIKLFSYRGDYVVDPFNGAGTTTAPARQLGRRYLGVDISPQYCKTASERAANQSPARAKSNLL